MLSYLESKILSTAIHISISTMVVWNGDSCLTHDISPIFIGVSVMRKLMLGPASSRMSHCPDFVGRKTKINQTTIYYHRILQFNSGKKIFHIFLSISLLPVFYTNKLLQQSWLFKYFQSQKTFSTTFVSTFILKHCRKTLDQIPLHSYKSPFFYQSSRKNSEKVFIYVPINKSTRSY